MAIGPEPSTSFHHTGSPGSVTASVGNSAQVEGNCDQANLARQTGSSSFCSPNGIRTRVATLRGWCPRPLDDGAERRLPEGIRRCSGGRTRTLNNWTRTSRVADYTTPEWVDDQVSRAIGGRQRRQVADTEGVPTCERGPLHHQASCSHSRWLKPIIRPSPTPTASLRK